MLQSLLLLLAMQPTFLCAIHSPQRVRPLRHPVLYCVLTLATMDLLWILNRILLPQPVIWLNFMIVFAGVFYLPFCAFPGHRRHAVLLYTMVMTMLLVIIVLTEQIMIALCPLVGMDPRRLLNMNDPVYFFIVLVNACISIPLLLAFTRFMRKIAVSAVFPSRALWFLVIPISQAVLVFLVNQHLEYRSTPRIWSFLLSSALLCIAADFSCIMGYRKYHEMEYFADKARQAEQQLVIQGEYYREMQENILRINQIRHDLQNQLKTAYYLLEQGHPEEVRRQLDTLSSCIQDRVGTRYCDNLMVDAVLRDKAGQCETYGIPLQLNVFVPPDIKIDNAHLCSTFSNLLDNCIAAARKVGPGSGPITLHSDIHRGYLIISCSNPSVPPSRENRKDIMRRHGLGTEIMKKLAAAHSGSFQTDFRNGRFHATLILKNR